MRKLTTMVALLLIGSVALLGAQAHAASMTDEAVLGNDRWSVNSSGNLVPNADSTYSIGDTDYEVASISVDSLTLGGDTITGASQIASPMESQGTYVRIQGNDNIKLYTSGNLDISGDLQADMLTLENGAVLDNASNNAVTLAENSDTLTATFTGDDISLDMSDGGVIFALTDATDGTVDFQTNNDSDDYIQISTSANEPLINSVGSCDLNITSSSGEIDFGDDNLTTTGTLDCGALTATSLAGCDTITGSTNSDVLDIGAATDDVLRWKSNDEKSIVRVEGYEAKDAAIQIISDDGDDAGDQWELLVDDTDQYLEIWNETTELIDIDTSGNIDMVAGTVFTMGNDETIKNSTDDTIQVASNDADCIFEIYSPKTSDGDAILEFKGDAGADATDRWRIVNDTGLGAIGFKNDQSVAGTFATVLAIAAADGDITTTGDIEIGDDFDLVLGADADINIQYDEAVDDQCLFVTTTTGATATTDPLFEFLVPASPTADQQVFGVAKGTQASNTALLTLDEDGDLAINGTFALGASDGDLLDNITDDVLRYASNDSDTTIMITGFEAKEARLTLYADEDDDATDGWEIAASTSATMTIGCDQSVAGTMVDVLTIAGADGDITTTGDIEIVDDMDLVLGTNADIKIQYDEAVDNQCLFVTTTTGATATTDPLFEFLAPTTPTADQQVFGIAKGSQASNTALWTVDEDGDTIVTGDTIITGSDLTLNAAGVKLTGDGDGALTLLGLGDGADEDLTINLDDTANTIVLSSSTSADYILGLASYGLGSAGVKLTGDGDGAITFLGLGDGDDEDFTMNLDDTANQVVCSSSTGVTTFDFGTIDVATDAVDVSEGNITNVGDVQLDSLTADDGTTVTVTAGDNLVMGTATASAGAFQMIEGAVASDPTFQITNAGGNDTVVSQTVGDIQITTADDIILDPDGLGIVIGDNADEDYLITWDGDTSDGTLNYDEDNADFEFDQDVYTTATFNGEHLVSTDDADVNDNLTAGDITIDEAAGVLYFSGGTSNTINCDANVLTIAAINGTNNENLTFDMDTTSNQVAVGTGTGVTIVDFGTIDLATDALDLSEGNITNGGEIACDLVDADSTALAIGDGDETVAIDSSDWDISTAGNMTGIGSITSDGTGSFSGACSFTGGFNTGVVAVTDAATYTILAANSGKLHYVPDLTQDITMDLPAEATGLNYVFVYGGAAEDAHDWTFDSENDSNYFIGGCTDFDDDDGTLGVVYANGTSNSIVKIDTPNAGTMVMLWCDGTHWIINGQVVSGTDTATAFSDQP